MKILFHGASVTQQGQADAYIVKLKEILTAEFEVLNKGYGGCHFSEAGVLTLSRDLDCYQDLDVCVLEWNTTVLASFNIDDLYYAVNQILSRGILPVFMLLARLDTIGFDRDSELAVIHICSKYNLPLLDLRYNILPDDLRDEVHTSESGALKYANAIYLWLSSLNVQYLIKNISSEIPVIQRSIALADNVDYLIPVGGGLNISVSSFSGPASISIMVLVGPQSGYVEFNSKIINLWDKW